ncbi:hypothetical protein [Methylomicrobium sp. Wu6]|uniref:hypothetical protein n=1 Tax=Methylomicrobium sp. Wu6 TaxID=3107928 RepID=UPI002DD69A9F|nr:hypothetical protein [Methylomicrobium sp. Wu6]MEC4750012.1 hypothetical protein [Methylomicrobium sp. Wu6]
MSGWKTKAGAFLLIVYGVLGTFFGLHGVDECMQFVGNGLIALGVGHKIDKTGVAYAQAQTSNVADLVRRNSK